MAYKKGHKSTKAEAEAGAANLQKWKQENPAGGAVTHGAFSKNVRARYGDGRTQEAKRLNTVIKNLIDDLGGAKNISAPQSLLLDNIRSKLIVLFQISQYVDNQETIINKDGDLVSCLGKNFTTYSESLRRDLEALYSIKRKSGSLSYEVAMKQLEVKK